MATATETAPLDEILDLDDLTSHPAVVIDTVSYRLLTLLEMAPIDRHRLHRLGVRGDTLMLQESLSAEEEAELEDIPNKQCRLVLLAPASVHEKLTNEQRQAVLNCFFFELPPAPAPAAPTAGTPFKRRLSTGASGSPASVASTAEAP